MTTEGASYAHCTTQMEKVKINWTPVRAKFRRSPVYLHPKGVAEHKKMDQKHRTVEILALHNMGAFEGLNG